MSNHLHLSIVICTYNRSHYVDNCIREIAKQIDDSNRNKLEVLVVDNNSRDNTAQMVGKLCKTMPWLNYIFEPNQGLSHARNCGAINASGTYICYLDDDAIPCCHYVSEVLNVLSGLEPDIFGGPIIPFYTSPKPFWFQDALETRCHSPYTGFVDCPISGGNFIIRSDLLKRLGMFSTEFGMFGDKLRLGEERELLERYRSKIDTKKRKIYYSQNCFVYHHVPKSKMTIRYLIRRAYESGRMRAQFTVRGREPIQQSAPLACKLTSLSMLRRVILGRNGIYPPIRLLHHLALVLGILVQRFTNAKEKQRT